jgi:hypothetical protein
MRTEFEDGSKTSLVITACPGLLSYLAGAVGQAWGGSPARNKEGGSSALNEDALAAKGSVCMSRVATSEPRLHDSDSQGSAEAQAFTCMASSSPPGVALGPGAALEPLPSLSVMGNPLEMPLWNVDVDVACESSSNVPTQGNRGALTPRSPPPAPLTQICPHPSYYLQVLDTG